MKLTALIGGGTVLSKKRPKIKHRPQRLWAELHCSIPLLLFESIFVFFCHSESKVLRVQLLFVLHAVFAFPSLWVLRVRLRLGVGLRRAKRGKQRQESFTTLAGEQWVCAVGKVRPGSGLRRGFGVRLANPRQSFWKALAFYLQRVRRDAGTFDTCREGPWISVWVARLSHDRAGGGGDLKMSLTDCVDMMHGLLKVRLELKRSSLSYLDVIIIWISSSHLNTLTQLRLDNACAHAPRHAN